MSRRLLTTYLTLVTILLILIEVPRILEYNDDLHDEAVATLGRDAGALALFAVEPLKQLESVSLHPIVADYHHRTGDHVVIVDNRGQVVAASNPRTSALGDLSNRAEIVAALAGQQTAGERYIQTQEDHAVYVAVPVASGGIVYGAARVSLDSDSLQAQARRFWAERGLLAGITLICTALLGLAIARWQARPVAALGATAAMFAAGDLDTRAPTERGPKDLRDLARRFNEMCDRLQTLIHSQRAFVADASHQLRAPLTALRLRLENLGPSLEPSALGDLEATIGESRRLSRILDELLLLAQAEAGALLMAQAEAEAGGYLDLDLAAATREHIALWTPLAAERQVRFAVEADQEIRGIITPTAFGQIVDNLLTNALNVAPAGSTVTVAVCPVGEQVELHVIDQGPGLSEQERERAFDRFWRAPSAAQASGSGLGLPIVRRLATSFGGEAELLPASPRCITGHITGIDAVVRLPRAAVPARAEP
ncbi:MAG: ATP-binding protein [Pseudonocardiaceae bacterium]